MLEFIFDLVYDPHQDRYLDLGVDAADRWVGDPYNATNFHRNSLMLDTLRKYPKTYIRRFYSSLSESQQATPESLRGWYEDGMPESTK